MMFPFRLRSATIFRQISGLLGTTLAPSSAPERDELVSEMSRQSERLEHQSLRRSHLPGGGSSGDVY